MKLAILLKTELSVIDGMNIACSEFLRALLNHNAIQEIHFYSTDSEKKVRDFWAALNPEKGSAFSTREIPQRFKSEAYDGLIGLDPQLGSIWAELRNQFDPTATPVLCLIHTLSAPMTRTIVNRIRGLFGPADTILTTSRAGKQAIKQGMALSPPSAGLPAFQGQLRMMPLGVDATFFSPGDKGQARKKMNLPETGLLIGTVGRLSAFTKMEFSTHLIACQPLIQASETPIHLVIAGKKESEGYLQKLHADAKILGIEKNVHFLTDFAREEAPEIYRSLDVFLSLSDHVQETFGQSLLEAMACGCPVVASDWSGYRDIVNHGQTGYLAETLWAECLDEMDYVSAMPLNSLGYQFDRYFVQSQTVATDLAATTNFLSRLTDDHLREKFTTAAVQRIKTTFSWPVIISGFVRTVQEVNRVKKIPGRVTPSDAWPLQKVFSHFPSRFIEKKEIIARTSRGIRILKGEKIMTEYSQFWDMLGQENLLRSLLALLDKPLAIGALIKKIEADSSAVLRTIMVALKYQLIEIKK